MQWKLKAMMQMLTDLKACYSPQDLIFVVSLFILAMSTIGAFSVLMTHAIRGAIDEVRNIKKDK